MQITSASEPIPFLSCILCSKDIITSLSEQFYEWQQAALTTTWSYANYREFPTNFPRIIFLCPDFFRMFELFGIKINDNFVIIHGNSCSQAQRLFLSSSRYTISLLRTLCREFPVGKGKARVLPLPVGIACRRCLPILHQSI